MPHALTEDIGPHAALRAADVSKSCGYAAPNQIGCRKHTHSLRHPPNAALRDMNVFDPDMQAGP